MTLAAILDRVAGYDCARVTVTGGEPLAQRGCIGLLTALCDAGYLVSLETSGALDIQPVDPRVERVMDWKTPGSGEAARNRLENIELLTPRDQIKVVLCDRADYDWAREELLKHDMTRRCEVLFSPVQGQLNPTDLAEWILADRLEVRMQIQLHKLLWGDEPGR